MIAIRWWKDNENNTQTSGSFSTSNCNSAFVWCEVFWHRLITVYVICSSCVIQNTTPRGGKQFLFTLKFYWSHQIAWQRCHLYISKVLLYSLQQSLSRAMENLGCLSWSYTANISSQHKMKRVSDKILDWYFLSQCTIKLISKCF